MHFGDQKHACRSKIGLIDNETYAKLKYIFLHGCLAIAVPLNRLEGNMVRVLHNVCGPKRP